MVSKVLPRKTVGWKMESRLWPVLIMRQGAGDVFFCETEGNFIVVIFGKIKEAN